MQSRAYSAGSSPVHHSPSAISTASNGSARPPALVTAEDAELEPLAVDEPAHLERSARGVDVPEVADTDLRVEQALHEVVVASGGR